MLAGVAGWAAVRGHVSSAAASQASTTDASIVADHASPAAEKKDEPSHPSCFLRGEMEMGAAWDLQASRHDDASGFAVFTHKTLGLEMLEVPSYGQGAVRLRARTSTGFALDGWLERKALTFSARKRIELAGSVAYVPRGARLRLKVGTADSVVVTSISEHIAPIDALVPCEELAMGHISQEPASTWIAPPGSTTELMQIKKHSLGVAPIPGGEPTFTLEEGTSRLYLSLVRTSEGLHLHYEDGIVVDGWVRETDVESLMMFGSAGIGCGGIGIGCGIGRVTYAQSGLARRRMPIYVGEAPSGDPRGTVDAGTEMIVLAEENGFAQVIPRCSEMLPKGKKKFFVATSALDLGPKVRRDTLEVGCKDTK